MNIERAYMIKHPHVPETLYKYRRFSPDHLDALHNNALWMSAPENFNDPYESALRFDPDRFIVEDMEPSDFISMTDELQRAVRAGELWQPPKIEHPIREGDWRAKTIRSLSATTPCDTEEFIKLIELFFEKQARESVELMAKGFRANFSVLSLSATLASHLMWAHYSDDHRGFVLEYDFSRLSYFDLRRRLCFPVFYTHKIRDATRYLAKTDMRDYNNLFGQLMCLVKNAEWAYEREWRIVHAIGGSFANSEIAMPEPSAIILGSRASTDNERTMYDYCRSREIPLRRIVQQADNYGLNTIDVTE